MNNEKKKQPHAAMVAQPKVPQWSKGALGDRKPPHPATVIQPKEPPLEAAEAFAPHRATLIPSKVPHPAKVMQPKASHAAKIPQRQMGEELDKPPHQATLQRSSMPERKWLPWGASAHSPHVSALQLMKRKRDGSDPPPPKKKKVEAPPHEAVTFFRNEVTTNIRGRNDAGVVFGTLEQRGARSFSGEEVPQFLRHISTFFYYLVNDLFVKQDAEIEAMLVRDRILISSNNPHTMSDLYEEIMAERTLLDVFLNIPDTSGDRRGARVIDRFQNTIMSPDIEYDVQLLAQGLALARVKNAVREVQIRGTGPMTVHGDVLLREAYRNKLILVSGLDLHAEQKLLRILVNSNVKKSEPVIIRGKKRPCFGCWLCLRFVADVLGYNLDYNTRPGKAWVAPVDGLKALIEKTLALEIDESTVSSWYAGLKEEYEKKSLHSHVSIKYGTTTQDPGFDSESDDDLDSY